MSWLQDTFGLNAKDLIDTGLDYRDRRADRRAADSADRRLRLNQRYRDTTNREDLERNDANTRILGRLRNDNERYRDTTNREDLERNDENEASLLGLRARTDQFRAETDREGLLRDDLIQAADEARDDDRLLLMSRGKLYREAFESRRGDTVVTRIAWPAALAVAVAGSVWVVRNWKAS